MPETAYCYDQYGVGKSARPRPCRSRARDARRGDLGRQPCVAAARSVLAGRPRGRVVQLHRGSPRPGQNRPETGRRPPKIETPDAAILHGFAPRVAYHVLPSEFSEHFWEVGGSSNVLKTLEEPWCHDRDSNPGPQPYQAGSSLFRFRDILRFHHKNHWLAVSPLRSCTP